MYSKNDLEKFEKMDFGEVFYNLWISSDIVRADWKPGSEVRSWESWF